MPRRQNKGQRRSAVAEAGTWVEEFGSRIDVFLRTSDVPCFTADVITGGGITLEWDRPLTSRDWCPFETRRNTCSRAKDHPHDKGGSMCSSHPCCRDTIQGRNDENVGHFQSLRSVVVVKACGEAHGAGTALEGSSQPGEHREPAWGYHLERPVPRNLLLADKPEGSTASRAAPPAGKGMPRTRACGTFQTQTVTETE